MKLKKIPKKYFITILDRLSRFEPACVRYKRVFDDIISKFLLDCPRKTLSFEDETNIACEIFNNSLQSTRDDFYINDVIAYLENKYFVSNKLSYQYLSTRLNISSMLDEIDENITMPKNVFWLKKLNRERGDLITLRNNFSLLYPVEKIVLCEGLTEFMLLKTIFSLFNIDFDKLGISTIAAGGKNQVAKKYYNMIEYIKTPVFILLDKDASSTAGLINTKLRKNDMLYLLKCGEFEDLIPPRVILNALNLAHSSEFSCQVDDFLPSHSTVHNLENIYKKYGFGEFKKARFAKILKEFIEKYCKEDDFLNSEIFKIKDLI